MILADGQDPVLPLLPVQMGCVAILVEPAASAGSTINHWRFSRMLLTGVTAAETLESSFVWMVLVGLRVEN